MNVAYCFSGYLRRFWDNRTLVEHIIARMPGDLFVHTWDRLNYAGQTWHGDRGLADVPVDTAVLSFLTARYGSPRRLVVDAPPVFPPALMPVIQARYSQWRANELKREVERERGNVYDLVVSLRFDLVVHEPVDFAVPADDRLGCVANRNCVTQALCCDILNFGTSRAMDVAADLYAAIRDGVVVEANTNSGERFLTRWCEMNRLPFTYATVRSSLLRSDGSLLEIPLPDAA